MFNYKTTRYKKTRIYWVEFSGYTLISSPLDIKQTDVRLETVLKFARRNKCVAAINTNGFSNWMNPSKINKAEDFHAWICNKIGTNYVNYRKAVLGEPIGAEVVPPYSSGGLIRPGNPHNPPIWLDGGNVIGGWTHFVKDGKFIGKGEARYPWTLIGKLFNGNHVFIVVDGRHNGGSVGLTATELCEWLKANLSLMWAWSVDGGGSSTLVINGKLENHPSDWVATLTKWIKPNDPLWKVKLLMPFAKAKAFFFKEPRLVGGCLGIVK